MTGAGRGGARTGAIGLAGAVCNGALGFALAVVVTRGFGPDGAGVLFVAIGVLTVAGVACCLGADTALVWALPRRRCGPGGDAGRLLPVAAAPALATALVVGLLGVLVAPQLAPLLLTGAGQSGEAVLRLTFAAVPVAVAMTLVLAAVRGVRPVGAYVGLQLVLLPASRPVLIGAVAMAGGGVLLGLTGFIAPMLVALLLGSILLMRSLRPVTVGSLRPRLADWRTVWRFALPRAGSAAIDSGSLWVGVWLTAALAGPAAAGVFGAVGRYAVAGLVALHGLRVAFAPQLSRLLGEGRRDQAAALHRQTTGWVIALAWPLYLLLAWFSPGFLAVFGAEFTAGATALTVLAVAMLVSTGLGNVQTLLLMSGRSGWHLAAVTAGLVSNVALALALIPRYGLVGAAVAWGSGIVIENVTATLAARIAVARPVLAVGQLRVAGAVLVCVGGASLVGAVTAGRGVAGLLVTVTLLVAVALALLTSRRVRQRLRSRWQHLRRPADPLATDEVANSGRSDGDDPGSVPRRGAARDPQPDPAGAGPVRRTDR